MRADLDPRVGDQVGRVEGWCIRVHRLVQEVVRRRLPPERIAECQTAVDILIRARDAALKTTTQWQRARWELEPLDALANLWADTDHAGASWLLNQTGQRWSDVAAWTCAEPLLRRALAIDEARYGAHDPEVATALNNLALLLQDTNRLREAEPLIRRALAIDETSYGPDHPVVAIRLNNLAVLFQETNRLSEAKPLMLRALGTLLQSTRDTHQEHRFLRIVVMNYAHLLAAIGVSGNEPHPGPRKHPLHGSREPRLPGQPIRRDIHRRAPQSRPVQPCDRYTALLLPLEHR
jgi:tetratricopeptide (TPR) repeat protein